MVKWTVFGTVIQTAMVLIGHWVTPVANLFGPLGVTISLIVGLLWSREYASRFTRGAGGGAVVGGLCALIGIGISWGLGDVEAVILALGTASSAVTGALGGLAGTRMGLGAPGPAR